MNKREAKRAELQAKLDASKEAKAAAKAVDPAKQAAIDDALNKISGAGKFLTKREIKELPSVLWDGELPMHLVDGRYNKGYGILVATDRRLVFMDKGLFSLKVEDFPYDRILSVEAKTGMVMGQLTIHTAAGKEEIQQVTKERVHPLAEWIRANIREDKTSPEPPVPVAAPSVSSLADELTKLAALRDQGILTDDEFNTQKARLLG